MSDVDFSAGYRLGYGTGYDVGFQHGADEAFEIVQSVLTGCTSVFRNPRQDDLKRIRNEVITSPCAVSCKRCSRCVRYAAWYRNGRCDYPGVSTVLTPLAVAS
jgi:hypothetical protein